MTLVDKLRKLEACKSAINWIEQNNYTTIDEIIDRCPRGDWLLWLAKNCDMELRLFTLAKGLCVNTVRDELADERSIKAVDTAIAFGRGEATEEELDAAADDAVDALHSYYYAAAASAASAACYSAYYSTADFQKKNLIQTANICREVFREELIKLFNEKTI